jgi:hypothetical protein
MARPWVADGEHGLQLWWVAENILKSSCGQPIRGDNPVWGVGKGLTTPYRKNTVTKCSRGHRKVRAFVNTVTNLRVL